MCYTSLRGELEKILDQFLLENSTVGETSVIRAIIFRLWQEIFNEPDSYKILVDSLDNLNWNANLDNLKDLILGLDEILVDIACLVEGNQIINYVELRGRITWLVNFLNASVGRYVRTARIKLIPNPGFAGQIVLYLSLDFERLSYLDRYDSENITAVNLYSDFGQLEIPKTELEEALQVSF